MEQSVPVGSQVESQQAMEEERDAMHRKRRRRNMEYDSNNVAANCYVADETFLKSFLDSGPDGKDGLLFGFASDMEGVASIPKQTFVQMTGVLQVLHSEDDVSDILSDSSLEVRTISKKSTTVRSASVKTVSNVGNGSIRKLLEASPMEYREIVGQMEDISRGEEAVGLYFGGEGSKKVQPLQHAKLFLTTHQVEYKQDEGRHGKKQVMVFWVYCAKNFDFVGKMWRMYSNHDSWRKHALLLKDKLRAELMEKQYSLWNEILLGLVSAVRLAKVWRGLEMRVGMDPMHNLVNDLHPESFYSMTNPLSVYNSICFMCPDDSTGIRVEGMNYQKIEECGLTTHQYLRRFVAYRKQFQNIKKAQEKEKKEQENAGEDCGMCEEEDAEGAGAEGEEVAGEEFSGNDAPFVCDVLANRQVDFFDEYGVSVHVSVPAWPLKYATANNLVSGLPETSVVAYLDFGTIAGDLGKIVNESPEWLLTQFGELPMRLRWRVNNAMMEHEGEEDGEENGVTLSESAFLPPSYAMEENKRRKMFSRLNNPFMGYIFDRVYEDHTSTFFREVVQRKERLKLYVFYIKSMQNHLRSDLLAGKARSVVLLSTQAYVDSKEFEIAPEAMEIMGDTRTRMSVDCVSDFEMYSNVYNSVVKKCNTGYWGLTGRNMFLFTCMNSSEILWRCGTAGNWKWIGMPLNVVDGAGLLLSKNGTNLKKAGTCGFDYTRNTRDMLRGLYKVTVPAFVLEQFKSADGQISSSTMRMTPTAVGEGLIQIVNDKIVGEPNEKTMGMMVILPEGLGDRESLENVVKFTPRDDKVDVQMETTVDLDKTGQRQKLIRKGVAGLTFCLCAFARNQQPIDLEMVRRTEDLLHVCTLVPSSGREDVETGDIVVQNEYDLALPWHAEQQQTGAASVVTANNTTMSLRDQKRYASFFSLVPMVTTLVCLQQKTAVLFWNVSPDVSFVLKETESWFVSYAPVILSRMKIEHSSRFFDSAVSMAGVSPTVQMRTYAEMAETARTGHSVHEAVCKISQLQSEDALHYSLIPAVLMRFLTGMIDYPAMWLLSALFREVEMPVIDLISSIELMSGVAVTNREDAATVKAYLVGRLRQHTLCADSEFGDVSESSNVTMYVTSDGGIDSRSPMRMKFNPSEATNKDLKKMVSEKLMKNVADVLEQDAKKYGQFCGDYHEISIEHAVKKLCSNDMNIMGLLGGGSVFYDHRAWVANVVGDGPGPKFKGVPLMHPGEFNILRVMHVGGGGIGYGINIPTALVYSSLMQKHSKGWGIQIQMAESLVTHVVEKYIPYSLLPINKANMDSFVTNQGVVESSFERKYRPLQIPRALGNQFAFQENDGGIENVKGGSTVYGVLEDTAHMQSVLSVASRLQYAHYWDLDLRQWNFEIKWGNRGDVTPLRFYENNRGLGEDETDSRFLGSDDAEQKRAYVVVGENNILELCVVTGGGSGQEVRMKCGDLHTDRVVQQKIVFGHKWGPAFKFQRSGILLSGVPLRTLVPFDEKSPAELVKDGLEGVEYFRDGCYLARSGGEGGDVKLCTEEVERRIVKAGLSVGISHRAPAMGLYKNNASQIHYRNDPGFVPKVGYQLAKIVIDDSKIPVHGLVSVVMQVKRRRSKAVTSVLRLNVAPSFIELFTAEEINGCHRFINIDEPNGRGR